CHDGESSPNPQSSEIQRADYVAIYGRAYAGMSRDIMSGFTKNLAERTFLLPRQC
ncbi:hypothetical protein ACLOJK_040610, partial [Asimina triloba]